MAKKKSNFVDISGFGEVVKQLSKITGKNFEKVLKAEVGMVVKGAISKTPVATIKGRRIRGKLRGGIVPRHIPESMELKGGVGNKLVTKRDGKTYHAGVPQLLTQYSDERAFKKTPQKGVGQGRGMHPKRGGKVWSRPGRHQPWMGRAKFLGEFVPEKFADAVRKIDNMGMGAGQFYWMAQELGIALPPISPKWKLKTISRSTVRSKVKQFIKPKKTVQKREAAYILESKGMKVSRYTQAAKVLNIAASNRIKFFKRAAKNGFLKDVKTFMPKNYPLLFK